MLGCVTDLTSYDFAVFSNHHVSFGCRFSSFIVKLYCNQKKTAALVLELEIWRLKIITNLICLVTV